MEETKYELVKFTDNELELEVSVSPKEETIWMTQEGIALLFGKSKSTINEHIKNILNYEFDRDEVVRKFGKTELSTIKTKPVYFYNLDLILAMGYRVNSKRGIMFRKWATKVHDRYIIIDQNKLYHLGHSIKDLGNKIFSISELDCKFIRVLISNL